ncbi:hypothetical protein P4O66_005681, partial [Electrophorus voltai]
TEPAVPVWTSSRNETTEKGHNLGSPEATNDIFVPLLHVQKGTSPLHSTAASDATSLVPGMRDATRPDPVPVPGARDGSYPDPVPVPGARVAARPGHVPVPGTRVAARPGHVPGPGTRVATRPVPAPGARVAAHHEPAPGARDAARPDQVLVPDSRDDAHPEPVPGLVVASWPILATQEVSQSILVPCVRSVPVGTPLDLSAAPLTTIATTPDPAALLSSTTPSSGLPDPQLTGTVVPPDPPPLTAAAVPLDLPDSPLNATATPPGPSLLSIASPDLAVPGVKEATPPVPAPRARLVPVVAPRDFPVAPVAATDVPLKTFETPSAMPRGDTGAPQGCVLSPLLYSLYTYDCTATSSSNIIVKFADDTLVMGLISDNDEREDLDEIKHLENWCQRNNLLLNVSKTKELIVECSKKCLRDFRLPSEVLQNFYTCTIESILMGNITDWFGNSTKHDRQAPQRVSTVQSIIRKWKEYSTSANLRRHGRPPKLTAQASRALLREAANRPMVTLEELQRSTAQVGGQDVTAEPAICLGNSMARLSGAVSFQNCPFPHRYTVLPISPCRRATDVHQRHFALSALRKHQWAGRVPGCGGARAAWNAGGTQATMQQHDWFSIFRSSHITPLLRCLHWLPVATCIRFKTLMLAYKAKNGPAPPYMMAVVKPDPYLEYFKP